MATPYRVDTRSARTDLSGIGKGQAQVIDLSTTDKMTMQKQKQAFVKEQAGLKAQKAKQTKREDDLLKLMAKSRGTKLKPGDMQYFKDAQNKLNQGMRDALVDNEINNEEYMKMLGLANQINAEADMAAKNKAHIEDVMGAYDERKHRPGSYEAAKKAYETQGGWGEQLKHIENIDIDKQYRALRKGTAEQFREQGREVTFEEAGGILERNLASNTQLLDQMKYNMSIEAGAKVAFEDITDEEAIQQYKDLYQPDLAREAAPQRVPAGFYARQKEEMLITIDESTGNVSFQDPKDPRGTKVSNVPHPTKTGERVEIHSVGFDTEEDPKTGKTVVKGATATINLSDEQKSENTKVYNENSKKEGRLMERMAWWDRQGENKPPVKSEGLKVPILGQVVAKETDAEFDAKMREWEKKREDFEVVETKKLKFKEEPHPTGTIELDKDDATRAFFEQSKGIKPETIIKQKERTPGAKVQTIRGGGKKATTSGIKWE